ncbi:hypothetical protein BC835DRAFT_1423341 [Cytidiella melzeri]|nr:hypothetical protein BC835DRAFT_1423341 [Cytidiella melzeri]
MSPTFTWRYRSKDLLQAQEIMPQDVPKPSVDPKRLVSTAPAEVPSKRQRKLKPIAETDLTQESSTKVKV